VALVPKTAQTQEQPMPDYMLFLYLNPDQPRPSSPDEALAITKTYVAWTDRIRAEGRHRAGLKLANGAGKILKSKGGRTSITDGPFAESKDVIGGFWAISAKDYDEACLVAETSPHLGYGGRIEVREIDEKYSI
jgi:hypothetical protein